MPTLIDQLGCVAQAYCAARGLSVARVSTLVFNDGSKLGSLISGATDLTTRRLEAAMLWFSENWPDGGVWPEGVARPEKFSPQTPPSVLPDISPSRREISSFVGVGEKAAAQKEAAQ